jgi:hypothetical protein
MTTTVPKLRVPLLPSCRRACVRFALRALGALGVLGGLAGPALAQPAAKAAFELVTAAEARQDREIRAKGEVEPEVRSRGAPAAAAQPGQQGQPVFTIRIIAPAQASVTAPLRIELAFEPLPGARVVPSTFRLLYGVMKLDLTERLRRFATITETGVVVDRAQVPEGQHRLLVQVSDDRGNVAQQELRVRVGAAS